METKQEIIKIFLSFIPCIIVLYFTIETKQEIIKIF
jgi:hypothetical protein